MTTRLESWTFLDSGDTGAPTERFKELGRGVTTGAGDTCFVVMPFAPPLGDYYSKVYEPAIVKAGLTPCSS